LAVLCCEALLGLSDLEDAAVPIMAVEILEVLAITKNWSTNLGLSDIQGVGGMINIDRCACFAINPMRLWRSRD
jgi:hypothetical protein